MNHLRATLRSLVIEALPHHNQTEVLHEAQVASEMIDQLDQDATKIEQFLDTFARHFAVQLPTPVLPATPAGIVDTEQMKDIRYAFSHGATVADLAAQYNVEQAVIFQIVSIRAAMPNSAPEAATSGNGNGTGRRGRPPGRKNQ